MLKLTLLANHVFLLVGPIVTSRLLTTLHCCKIVYLQHGGGNYCRHWTEWGGCYSVYPVIVDTVGENDVIDDGAVESEVTPPSDHMTMSFMMGKKEVRLEMDKNENIPPLRSYFTAENGKLIQWTLDEEQVNELTFAICR